MQIGATGQNGNRSTSNLFDCPKDLTNDLWVKNLASVKWHDNSLSIAKVNAVTSFRAHQDKPGSK